MQFHFVNGKIFWTGQKTTFYEKFLPSVFIPKMKLDFQNINWEFRSFGYQIEMCTANNKQKLKESSCFQSTQLKNIVCHLGIIQLRSIIAFFTFSTNYRECLYVSTTPLWQWDFRQCLSFSWKTLRGKHCRHLIAVIGVLDTFGQ